ncbi:carboxypeptidase-like regulatory domain-containing protein [Limnoglobus roseus]|uniref:Carboxypeptidase regulatory-like domain-containing protein n=1 Tax=Limnoglobus roseus TaxID=2598579 RepID=A0A5C1AFF3_9BACT|nr:carboxypeptidase-like regulatory domain-containing protein [Limnoglobus roseus]QEL17305.1 carboxypeptidase regulatory-like domain-containing protein [Limnoglobus roseus]
MKPHLLILVAALGVVGCGPSLGTLSGKVCYNGRPVVYGTVVVIDSEGLPHPGTIEPDGRYEVSGLPAGVATICVTSPSPPGTENKLPPGPKGRSQKADAMRTKREDEPTPAAPADVISNWQSIPDRFSDPTQSKLQFTVRRGSNSWDIPLD